MIRNFTQKIFIASLIILGSNRMAAQTLVNHDFFYSGNLTANGWVAHSGVNTNPIATTTGLSYSGYGGTSVGNNAALVNNVTGEDDNITFVSQSTNAQSIYYSFLVKITDAAATKSGDYFIHLGNGGGSTLSKYFARVFAQITATGVNFGISNTASTSSIVYGTTNYAINTTYLIVVKYTINTAGDDPLSLWVFTSGVPATELAAGAAQAVATATLGENVVDAIALRQGNSGSTQTVVDAIRVGKTWGDLVAPSGGTLPIKLDFLKGHKQNNNNSLNWKVTCNSTNIAMEIERSSDAKNFKSVNAINATHARCSQPFDFTDAQPLQGNNFYRLKMIDIDGKISYSPTVLILNGGKTFELVALYPSLVKNETVVSISSEKATTLDSRITDMHGRTVKSFKQAITTGSSLINVDCNNLVAGLYNYTGITADGTVKTIRFVKL